VSGINRKDFFKSKGDQWRECCERKESQGFKSKGDERRERLL
jgi:hypothetical protein